MVLLAASKVLEVVGVARRIVRAPARCYSLKPFCKANVQVALLCVGVAALTKRRIMRDAATLTRVDLDL